MTKDEDVFIKIENPKQTRKVILESTRDVLKVLQGYEDFKKVRDRRTLAVSKFRNDMSHIRSLVMDLKKMLPKTNSREFRNPFMVMQESQKPVKEVRKLEQELSDIEEKLNSL